MCVSSVYECVCERESVCVFESVCMSVCEREIRVVCECVYECV